MALGGEGQATGSPQQESRTKKPSARGAGRGCLKLLAAPVLIINTGVANKQPAMQPACGWLCELRRSQGRWLLGRTARGALAAGGRRLHPGCGIRGTAQPSWHNRTERKPRLLGLLVDSPSSLSLSPPPVSRCKHYISPPPPLSLSKRQSKRHVRIPRSRSRQSSAP